MLPRTILKLLLISVALTVASVVRAQTPLTTCVSIEVVNGPTEVEQGVPVVFKATVTGTIHPTKPEFKWTVSAGTITSGQGTDEITVDSTGLGGVEITATVELAGAPPGCKASSSKPTQVKNAPIACGLPFDQYGDIAYEDEKARLDNFAIQLANEPQASGYIFMFAGAETYKNESAERLARAKSWLVDVRGTDRNRVVTNDCGYARDLSIRLIVLPLGANPPDCAAFVSTPFSDIKFTKPRPKSSKRRH